MRFEFPKDFLFGAASSACQIESGCCEGGKGDDIHTYNYKFHPEQYLHGDFNKSADFYHLYPQDIEMMRQLGMRCFRFSISWSRIYPNGPDEVCQAGLQYYSDMIDRLHAAGITTFFDLWHCDMPQWTAEAGGLLNPSFADWFVSYAKTVFTALGDRVDYWSTVNEPNINCMRVYEQGWFQPYVADRKKAIEGSHNMILAHYRTVRLYKQMGFTGKIGAVVHIEPCYCLSNDPRDEAAAQRKQAYYSGWWLDSMLKGHYPDVLMQYPYLQNMMPENYQQQMDELFIASDFIGVNYYNPNFAKYVDDGQLEFEEVKNESLPTDDYGFAFYPDGLYDTVMELKETYPGKEIIITENGIAKNKWGNYDEELHDDYRIDHLRAHLRALSRAIRAGAPVKGYLHWSLMDTNELRSGGYSMMFGLTQVNYETLERRPRDSWKYYQAVIERGVVF